MPTLYSYCIPIDDGAAPNPIWGVCTLVICKPRIRSTAKVGDWIVGTGSVNSPVGDNSGQVVYTMRVSQKMTMEAYDAYVKDHLPEKIPEWCSRDVCKRLGDSIYDFSTDPPILRQSVHREENRKKDLGGRWLCCQTTSSILVKTQEDCQIIYSRSSNKARAIARMQTLRITKHFYPGSAVWG